MRQIKKKVSFQNIIDVIMIPNMNDDYENRCHFWWDNNDIFNATQSAIHEIQRLLNIHPSMEKKQAIRLLHQPNNISYNEENFYTIED